MGNFNPMHPPDQGGYPPCFPLTGDDSLRHYQNHFPQAPQPVHQRLLHLLHPSRVRGLPRHQHFIVLNLIRKEIHRHGAARQTAA